MSRQADFQFEAGVDGVYRAPASTAAWRARAESQGLAWCTLDLDGAATKQAFLDCCAKALHFPATFGGNWDALADCLEDLSWQPAGGVVVHWRNGGIFARQPAEFRTALEIFGAAALFWKAQQRVFIVLMDSGSHDGTVTAFPPHR